MTPRKLSRGEVITEDGLYDIPIKRYHHDPDLCDGPSISSTGLRQVLACPAKYWDTSIYNPSPREKPQTQPFAFGKAAHSLNLEGQLPRRDFAVHPFANFSTNEGRAGPYGRHKSYREYKKAWKAKAEKLGLAILSGEDLRTIKEIYDALLAHPFVIAGGFQGLVEASLIWRDAETGIWLKSRPDIVPLGDAYADAKFVADASFRATELAIMKYRYDMQAALVGEGLAKVLGRPMANAVLFCVEKTPPYVAEDWEFHDKYIACGHADNHTALRLFAECMKTGNWGGYDRPANTIAPPAFIERQALSGQKYDIGTLEELT